MIVGSSFVLSAGGQSGPIINDHFGAYLGALLVYFIINVFLLGFYYYLLYRGSLYDILKSFIKDTLLVYLSTLILSLVLSVLIVHNGVFGLTLFIGLSVMLSYSFKQLFTMYNEVQEKAIRINGRACIITVILKVYWRTRSRKPRPMRRHCRWP